MTAGMKKLLGGVGLVGLAAAAAALALRRRLGPLRAGRGLAALQLAARGGLRYASSCATTWRCRPRRTSPTRWGR